MKPFPRFPATPYIQLSVPARFWCESSTIGIPRLRWKLFLYRSLSRDVMANMVGCHMPMVLDMTWYLLPHRQFRAGNRKAIARAIIRFVSDLA